MDLALFMVFEFLKPIYYMNKHISIHIIPLTLLFIASATVALPHLKIATTTVSMTRGTKHLKVRKTVIVWNQY